MSYRLLLLKEAEELGMLSLLQLFNLPIKLLDSLIRCNTKVMNESFDLWKAKRYLVKKEVQTNFLVWNCSVASISSRFPHHYKRTRNLCLISYSAALGFYMNLLRNHYGK